MLKYSIRFFSVFMMIGFLLFLAACQQEKVIASGQATPTHTIPSPTSTPAPTQTIPTSTPTPIPTLDWSTYTGHGITIKYPSTWHQGNSDRFVQATTIDFQPYSNDKTPYLSTTIYSANPGGSLDELLSYWSGINMEQYSNVHQVGPNSTTTLDGITWRVATFTATDKGVSLKEVDMVGENYPKVYHLTIRDRASSYDQTNTTIFQPMLQSLQLS